MSSDGDATKTEHRIRCGGKVKGPRGSLGFDLDGKPCSAVLRIDHLHRKLLSAITDRALDLMEIATFVYAADSAISRGGLSDPKLGAAWRRELHFDVPVRDPEIWSQDDVRRPLIETLGLLSDDIYHFSFRSHEGSAVPEDYFDFGCSRRVKLTGIGSA